MAGRRPRTESASLDRNRWRRLCDKLGLVEPTGTFRRLQRNYTERHRKYHNARHINECLELLDCSRHPQAGEPLIEFALWFHDAVYNTFSSKNERLSARWAVKTLREGGVDRGSRNFVESLIMATRHGELPSFPSHQLLVDIDLSILGAPPQRYDEFERQIRSEYWWVPAQIYRRKRRAVLESFADRSVIYATQEFRERFEEQARINLKRSLKELKI